ncbi:MAG TPA: glycosyl hydrolase, partial [Bacillota bacterium]|nr:glycosyl hydrolase [Bacillota bacterium]
GGALLCDAGGAEQDGNDRVPHGPTFFSPEWRELYKHTLREADRLGLEISLNILSGWNLGGPVVSADDAAKKLVWSETRVTGPATLAQTLPAPPRRDNYYRDLCVVAYRVKPELEVKGPFTGITASSEQADHPAKAAADGSTSSFWVSGSHGPARTNAQWLQLAFARSIRADHFTLQGRPGYGPKECELQVSEDGKSFRTVTNFSAGTDGQASVNFAAIAGRLFRVVIWSAYDPASPQAPRNVQVAELQLSGQEGVWPASGPARRPLQNWEQKALHKALSFSAPDTTPLLRDVPAAAGEEDTQAAAVVDLSAKLDAHGVLRWQAPAGTWEILRFGCTIGDHSRVSTCSEGWDGYALDVLDGGAFQRYWNAVVEPLLADAGPLAGKSLKYLHTDSWEVEAVNWTPTLRKEFRKRRGYDLVPFLPVLAGRIVDSRPVSNRFLHDFRKTLGDLAIDNHYRIFRDLAHKHGLEIHPESGGPHAVPIDAQRCLGWDDAPMSEFWAWSWRHRIGDENRFFVKQPASAAHTYGHRLVLAEGFTTIGPHWQETIWDNLKPAFDKALCEGLNLLVWHAFVCSPAEMGLPGQQYFAGTHFNPNTTWWAKSGAFLGYVDRCQFLLQQGLFAADV